MKGSTEKVQRARKSALDKGKYASRLHRLLSITAVIIIFIFLTIRYISGLSTHSFHIDEYLFTQRSFYLDLFLRRDFSDWRWYWNDSSAQPKVGPYVFGISLHLAGIDNIEQELIKRGFEDYLEFRKHWTFHFMNKPLIDPPATILPQLELIRISRMTSVVFALGSFVLLLFLTYRIKGTLFAITSTLLLGTNSLMLVYGKRAMTDSMQLFFFFLTLLLMTVFLQAHERKNSSRANWVGVAIGASAALGVGVKISGIFNVLFMIIVCMTLAAMKYGNKETLIPLVKSAVIIASTFMILFYALHPYLYHDPLRNFVGMFSDRLIASEQANMLAFPGTAVHSRLKAAQLVLKNTLLPGGEYVNFRLRLFPLDLILFSWGFVQMGTLAVRDLRQKKIISGDVMLITWVVLVTTGLIFYLQNNWDRYYLPSVAAVTLVEAYAISTLLNKLVNRISPGKTKGYLQQPGGKQT